MFGYTSSDIRLLGNFLKMMFRDRYLGSMLGSVWGVANPLIMLSIFTFIFVFVFRSKLPGADSTLAYTIWLISGYGPWLALNDSMMSGTNSVVSSTTILKNLAFKSEILPLAGTLMGIVPLAVSLSFLSIIILIDDMTIGIAVFYVPIAILLQFTFIAGITLLLSAINVFVRDVSHILPNVLLACLFLSPIFYSIDSLPGIFKVISQANPFYLITEGYRQPILFNQLPPLGGQVFLAVVSGGMFFFGLRTFRRFKPYFDARL
ncbi:MAG: ABC transporter permease [Rhodospirillales bacterium]